MRNLIRRGYAHNTLDDLRGFAHKEIAARLAIAPKTVEFHKTQIMQRLGVNSVAQLIKYALDSGIVGP